MESSDELFDRLDPRWRGPVRTEEISPGLVLSRFGTGNAEVTFESVEVTGEGHRLLIAADTDVRSLRVSIKGSGTALFLGGGGLFREVTIRLRHAGSIIAFGRNVMTGSTLLVSGEGRKIVVGDDCLFSFGISIRNTDMHPIYRLSDDQRINPAADVSIGRHVWVGQDVRITKGATIGPDTVIGTSAFVSGNIPANCVAAGVPAKVLEEGITWDRSLTSPSRHARNQGG